MAEIHNADEGPVVGLTVQPVKMTKTEKALQKLREDLFHDIMLNTTEGDDCDFCKAYRHSAEIVMGRSYAEPPSIIKEH